MIKNKKGFTLIELLAVIVVLAILILLASNNYLSQLDRARKNALAIEGNTLINAAKQAYETAILESRITSGSACFSLEYLYQEGIYSKGSKNNYTGSVLVSFDDKIPTYTFWISNGTFVIQGGTGETGTNNATKGASASNNCDGAVLEHEDQYFN